MERVYKGNIYLNGNTIVIAITGILYLWLLIFIRTTLISVVIFSTAWLYIFIKVSFQVYYFILKDNVLMIRNHYLPWIEDIFPIEEIQGSSFEKRFKMAYSLEISTKGKLSNYCGSTLTIRNWLTLKADLESKGLHVNNEYISE